MYQILFDICWTNLVALTRYPQVVIIGARHNYLKLFCNRLLVIVGTIHHRIISVQKLPHICTLHIVKMGKSGGDIQMIKNDIFMIFP